MDSHCRVSWCTGNVVIFEMQLVLNRPGYHKSKRELSWFASVSHGGCQVTISKDLEHRGLVCKIQLQISKLVLTFLF
jgi:hypothetical protein